MIHILVDHETRIQVFNSEIWAKYRAFTENTFDQNRNVFRILQYRTPILSKEGELWLLKQINQRTLLGKTECFFEFKLKYSGWLRYWKSNTEYIFI